jgi:hypothetical protein
MKSKQVKLPQQTGSRYGDNRVGPGPAKQAPRATKGVKLGTPTKASKPGTGK